MRHPLELTRLIPLLALAAAIIATSSAYCQTPPRVEVRPVSVPLPKVIVMVDGKMVQAESIQLVRGQQVMVWLRDLEQLGWGRTEPGQPGQFVFKGDNVTLTFLKGQSVAKVNSLTVQLPVDTCIRDGKLMVPLSFVAKSLGYTYECEYKLIAAVTTSKSGPSAGRNSIKGKVAYNGKAVGGIKVRAADPKFNAVPGATDVTDAEGMFEIGGLPDGDYVAYVYSGDNPRYVSRASSAHSVSGGLGVDVGTVTLIHAIVPSSPKSGGTARVSRGNVNLSWSACEAATSYKLLITKQGSTQSVAQVTSTRTRAELPASKFRPDTVYEARVTAFDSAGKALGATSGSAPKEWTFQVEWPM